MKLINTYILEVKKSKFIAYYYEVNSKNDIDEILEILKKEHKKAKHIPYAYKIDNIVKKSDDKEPCNTAGTPIYNIIMQNELNNVFIAVVRYFGGTLLGTGGLMVAYREATKDALNNAKVE